MDYKGSEQEGKFIILDFVTELIIFNLGEHDKKHGFEMLAGATGSSSNTVITKLKS